jgi:hypothetical protein
MNEVGGKEMLAESLTNKLAVRGNGSAGIIKTAGTAGRRQIVDVITLAFATDPVARWAYPNSQQYLEYFPNFIRFFGGGALASARNKPRRRRARRAFSKHGVA